MPCLGGDCPPTPTPTSHPPPTHITHTHTGRTSACVNGRHRQQPGQHLGRSGSGWAVLILGAAAEGRPQRVGVGGWGVWWWWWGGGRRGVEGCTWASGLPCLPCAHCLKAACQSAPPALLPRCGFWHGRYGCMPPWAQAMDAQLEGGCPQGKRPACTERTSGLPPAAPGRQAQPQAQPAPAPAWMGGGKVCGQLQLRALLGRGEKRRVGSWRGQGGAAAALQPPPRDRSTIPDNAEQTGVGRAAGRLPAPAAHAWARTLPC